MQRVDPPTTTAADLNVSQITHEIPVVEDRGPTILSPQQTNVSRFRGANATDVDVVGDQDYDVYYHRRKSIATLRAKAVEYASRIGGGGLYDDMFRGEAGVVAGSGGSSSGGGGSGGGNGILC